MGKKNIQIDAALEEENTKRVVELIRDVIVRLQIQVISISHHSSFQKQATHVIQVSLLRRFSYSWGRTIMGLQSSSINLVFIENIRLERNNNKENSQ